MGIEAGCYFYKSKIAHELFRIHCHPHICELDKIEKKDLSKQQMKSLNSILNFIRNQK